MAAVVIPKERRSALNKLRTLPETSLQAVLLALGSSPKEITSTPGLPPDEAAEIRDIVTVLYNVRAYMHMQVPEFVSGVAESLQQTEAFPVDELPAFKDRLTKLLTIDAFSVAQKAESLKAEYEHIFRAARILTDARPVYGSDPSKTPAAALIIHTLRIGYYDEAARLREIYFAMDGEDITALQQLLIRAESKAKSLESIFAAANVRVLNTGQK